MSATRIRKCSNFLCPSKIEEMMACSLRSMRKGQKHLLKQIEEEIACRRLGETST